MQEAEEKVFGFGVPETDEAIIDKLSYAVSTGTNCDVTNLKRLVLGQCSSSTYIPEEVWGALGSLQTVSQELHSTLPVYSVIQCRKLILFSYCESAS